ncbi:MAG: phospholipase [Lysobacteraceae bacterium]|nr:MAG: phospholipase [Xanthomonadaceae bacterium]
MSTMQLHTDASLAYLAPAVPARPRRLLVLCHGVGGNETNLLALAQHSPADTVAVLARGPLALAPSQYAWFQVAFGPHGPRPDLGAAEQSRQQLAIFIEQMQTAHGIAAADTVVAGFSQGGIMSASVALTRPELVAGFGVLAGRILPELEPQVATADALRLLRAFIGHGRDDSKLAVDWAHRADAWLTRLGIGHETRLYPGDHAITAQMQADFLAWFAATAGRAPSLGTTSTSGHAA